MSRPIERDLTTDVVVATNRLIEAKQGGTGQVQADAIASLANLLANQPEAIQILGTLQNHEGPIKRTIDSGKPNGLANR